MPTTRALAALALSTLASTPAWPGEQPVKRRQPEPTPAVFIDREAAPQTGRFRALLAPEGFTDDAGATTESQGGARYQSIPTLRLSSGFMFISGQQSVVETDKTTVHSWGTKFIVWARGADNAARLPRRDVVFAIDHPVCVTPGVDLNIPVGGPCDRGTNVPAGHYIVISYPDNAPPEIAAPAPVNAIADATTANFFRYATSRGRELGE